MGPKAGGRGDQRGYVRTRSAARITRSRVGDAARRVRAGPGLAVFSEIYRNILGKLPMRCNGDYMAKIFS
jgi:hypothetical protein